MIQLHLVTLQRGQRTLLDKASLTIHSQQKVGIIGHNGTGKTSLFLLLQSKLHADHGEVLLPKAATWAHLQQHIPQEDIAARQYAAEGDRQWSSLQRQLQHAEETADGLAIAEIHAQLAAIDGYSTEHRAAKILAGLGFKTSEIDNSVTTFSGGWQMRLNLARLLMSRADILMLDEPTNHLDIEAICWLEGFLRASQQTLLIISHDREFLNQVTTHTVHLHQRQLTLYTGNFSAFEKQRAMQLAVQQAAYQKQQRYRQHMQQFVDRFRYKASKARQAQSRLKMLEKMSTIAELQAEHSLHFNFKAHRNCANPLLQLKHVTIGYHQPIVKDINIVLNQGDRIGLIGPNGAGKSTLIKAIAGQDILLAGSRSTNQHINIGYFAQHQLEQLDPTLTPMSTLQQQAPEATEARLRQYLGSFNFQQEDVFRAIGEFSGGERARLVLALIIWHAPNLLLLDEPTNHLDISMRDALNIALQSYQGALVIISHDRYLLKSVVNDLWLVHQSTVSDYHGSVDDYQQYLASQNKDTSASINHTPSNPQTKRQQTKIQQRLAARLDKLEQKLNKLSMQRQQLDQKLAALAATHSQSRDEYDQVNQERKQLSTTIETLEEEIYTLMAQLDD